jgi:hypothetical protein
MLWVVASGLMFEEVEPKATKRPSGIIVGVPNRPLERSP